MKKALSIILIALVCSCSSSKKTSNSNEVKPEITEKAIRASMEYLTSDELEGRATGTEGIEKAAVFIENYLKSNGIKPYFKTYRDSFKLNDLDGYNIVGLIEGNDPKLKNEYIILGGHYDHIGKGKVVEGDSIANGANDDASGTIAAMEFGRYFAQSKSNKRSILITLYDAEELGLKGSAHLAKRLKDKGLNVYTMINFEMIGVARASTEPMAYMSGYERSSLAETLNKYAGEEVVGFFDRAKKMNLFMRSDNFPFFKELNIPAHAISTFDFTNYDYYHHVDDEADKMDYEHMVNFINKMIPALEGMMNAPTKEVILKDE
ncbi:M28 family peptidase [Winogradskyella psychrotolerans]|nr:M28 family peptidase [Winogradskyella psychrotolerans]MBU2922272.1 M28 family peptidase [Winogradskyella psychrotolerans]